MLPDQDRQVSFQLSPIEQHFFDVADKHGVLDSMIDGNLGDEYGEYDYWLS